MKKSIIVAGLDIGTTKTCAIIAERTEPNKFNILGVGTAPSEGMLRGQVANSSKVAETIRKAVDIAEHQAGFKITAVNIGVAGIHIRSMRHRNYVTINNPDKEISQQDIDRLFNDVKLTRIPADYKILHIIPEEYFVDDVPCLQRPVGNYGSKLEAATHVVLAQITALDNLKKSVEKAGLKVQNTILQPIASARSVLDPNEKDLGIAIIDIGGGTTDIAVYVNNSIRYSNVMGIAGNHVTNDLRSAFNIVTEQAERLKIEYGFATPKSIIEDQEIYVKSVSARPPLKISIGVLSHVIYLRMQELFKLIDFELNSSKLKDKIKCGIVLTGGGSLIKGSDLLGQEVFGLPCRIGMPLEVGGGLYQMVESPVYSTAMGLLMGGIEENPEINDKEIYVTPLRKNVIPGKNIFSKVKKFFDDL